MYFLINELVNALKESPILEGVKADEAFMKALRAKLEAYQG